MLISYGDNSGLVWQTDYFNDWSRLEREWRNMNPNKRLVFALKTNFKKTRQYQGKKINNFELQIPIFAQMKDFSLMDHT